MKEEEVLGFFFCGLKNGKPIARRMSEFFKKFFALMGNILFMIFEAILSILALLFEIWFITVIAVFIFVAWYLGLLT